MTARRWSGCCARAPGVPRRLRRLRRCWARSVIVASSSTLAGCPSSGCMTSSTRSARACRRRSDTGGRSELEDAVRARGVGLRGRVRRPGAIGPVAAGARHRAGSARPTRASGSRVGSGCWRRPPDAELRAAAARPRRRALAGPARGHRRARGPAGRAARGHRRTDPDQPARGRGRPRRGFAAHTLPIERWPSAEQLYSATGLAPASYQSATVTRRGRISRQGLPEHRDALMGIAWGLAQHSPAFAERDREYRARGFRPIQARVALARHACRLAWRLITPNSPTTIGVTIAPGTGAGGDGHHSYAARRRNLACRPPARPLLTAHTKACRTTAPDQPAAPPHGRRAPPTDPRKHRDHRSRRLHPRPLTLDRRRESWDSPRNVPDQDEAPGWPSPAHPMAADEESGASSHGEATCSLGTTAGAQVRSSSPAKELFGARARPPARCRVGRRAGAEVADCCSTTNGAVCSHPADSRRAIESDESEQWPTRRARTCWLLLSTDASVAARTQRTPAQDETRQSLARVSAATASDGSS